MTDNDKPAHVVNGANGVFALADARLAKINPDGTYSEPVPIDFVIAKARNMHNSAVFHLNDAISRENLPIEWTWNTMTRKQFKMLQGVIMGSSKLHRRKVLHAIKRRSERELRKAAK